MHIDACEFSGLRKKLGQPFHKAVLTLNMFLAFCDHMRKEKVFFITSALMVLYLFFVVFLLVHINGGVKNIKATNSNQDSKKIGIFLPALDDTGKGLIANLSIELRKGEGRTLIDINKLSFWEDTQDSIRLSRLVAENITGIDSSGYDIIYSIDADADSIEGPSAGPAMTIATSLALQDRKINNSVIISGYLKEDGSIGKITGLLEKAKAAKEKNFKLFLVPRGEKIQKVSYSQKICLDSSSSTFCETKIFQRDIEIEKEVGIEVIEVENISEALRYFSN